MHSANRLNGALFGMVAAILLTTSAAFAQNANNLPQPDPTGEWLVAKKIARIRVVDCDNRMWGIVSWEARPGIDKNNPDTQLRTRPTLGMPILLGMTQSKPDKWEGEIYNSEDGRTYNASISLLGPDTLKVQGCVLGFLCGGENWSRVGPSDSERAAEASAPPANGAPGAKPKLNNQQPAKRQAGTPNGRAQNAKPSGNRPSSVPQGAAGNANAEVTPEMLDSEPAADACSRIAGSPGLAH